MLEMRPQQYKGAETVPDTITFNNVHKKTAVLTAAAVFLIIAAVYLIHAELRVSTPLVVVEGNSMLPTLYSGDLVLIHKPSPSDIKIGDIIVYKSPSTGRLVIHRVIKINVKTDNGGIMYYYVTKGDNNPIDDVSQGLEPVGGIPYSDILGTVLTINCCGSKAPLRIPYLGLLTRVLRG